MKRILILFFIAVVFITGCGNTGSDGENMISVDDVKMIIENYKNEEDVYIVDVREKTEYKSGHLKNAINLPLSILETIELDKDAKIIVYCQSGRRSKEAQLRLKDLGYVEVYDMGGINSWPYELDDNI